MTSSAAVYLRPRAFGISSAALQGRPSRCKSTKVSAVKKPSWELDKPERLWEAGGELW